MFSSRRNSISASSRWAEDWPWLAVAMPLTRCSDGCRNAAMGDRLGSGRFMTLSVGNIHTI
ncbi:hypothetical protein CV_3712 [Chromobacterium violaceum ATCC 12472]|uniref:Uncharacterized protein n=1 Tax=Chromobacterium violaceum (strain ATCC 12472 / DSM 30191 / JCM 1249 / CCUG 213 / NBRC 12614 / NCIMB 9131 / NCTC 9757 / MK) TaxID=243365 RepID=Q7NRR8_CHRVO|nr:hypothetical protein CV_3712 [Chromobacterium violaceum ATCC 12472]